METSENPYTDQLEVECLKLVPKRSSSDGRKQPVQARVVQNQKELETIQQISNCVREDLFEPPPEPDSNLDISDLLDSGAITMRVNHPTDEKQVSERPKGPNRF